MKVVVVDGSGVKGRAAEVESALVERGFRSGGSADASSGDYAKTQVRYASGKARKGLTAALYIGTANVVEAATTSVQDGSRNLRGDVLVILGRDYPDLRGILGQSDLPTTAPSTGSTTTTTTSTTTPTTTPDTRYVPISPNSLEPLVGCP